MNVIVQTSSKVKKDFLKVVTLYYVQYLNLTRSRYTVTVRLVPKLKRESKVYGMTYRIATKHLMVDIDSRLNLDDMIGTLAHEMVHVKQFALGQLREGKVIKGTQTWVWCGKQVKKPYHTQPWEIEAYSKEIDLINEFYAIIEKDNQLIP